ncbi:MAG: replication-associated recombination protein A, partial [Gammaproteobacteria bacterium]
LDAGKPLRAAAEGKSLHSMVLWGPPGTGKTTLARLLAHVYDAEFIPLSAVLAGVKDVRSAVDHARMVKSGSGKPTILFLDEVHRFNKSQQDAFLPFVEDGTLVFVGATTENPSFELNSALLSRARTYVLKRLEQMDIEAIIDQALADDERGLGGRGIALAPEHRAVLAQAADGDARRALNLLEVAADLAEPDGDGSATITGAVIEDVVAGGLRRFDKRGEAFYDQISALHKAVRGSNPDAALYWLARMLDGGCDPLYVARRVVRMASEDVGNADPRALRLTLDAWDVQERLGSPEGELAIAQAVVYLAVAPKSNAVYTAFGAARRDVGKHGSLDVPLKLRNAPTKLMKELDYGKSYRYAHDEEGGYAAGETYFPDEMGEQVYYHPVQRGLEIRIAEKLAEFRERDRKQTKKRKPAP